MANFKIGDRVRIIVPGRGPEYVLGIPVPAGKEGTVTSGLLSDRFVKEGIYRVQVDGVPNPRNPKGWRVRSYDLRPILPVRDAIKTSKELFTKLGVKNLKPARKSLPSPVREKETA